MLSSGTLNYAVRLLLAISMVEYNKPNIPYFDVECFHRYLTAGSKQKAHEFILELRLTALVDWARFSNHWRSHNALYFRWAWNDTDFPFLCCVIQLGCGHRLVKWLMEMHMCAHDIVEQVPLTCLVPFLHFEDISSLHCQKQFGRYYAFEIWICTR